MALSSSPPGDGNRRESKEWDASKVPPSQFQRRKGSIYSTPNSRDGHVKGSSRDQAYWEKLKEKVCRLVFPESSEHPALLFSCYEDSHADNDSGLARKLRLQVIHLATRNDTYTPDRGVMVGSLVWSPDKELITFHTIV
jgi:hypothetical protein